MTPETLSRLEKMYAEVWPSAPAEIYQSFKDLAEALKEAWVVAQQVGLRLEDFRIAAEDLKLQLQDRQESEGYLREALRTCNEHIAAQLREIEKLREEISEHRAAETLRVRDVTERDQGFVWVLEEGERYEGGRTIGLFSSPERARAKAISLHRGEPWELVVDREDGTAQWHYEPYWMDITLRRVDE